MPAALDLSVLTPQEAEALIKQARAEAWRRGELSFKFDDTQHRIFEALKKAKRRKFFLLCSRRLGKTFTLLCLAFETAIKKPNAHIVYLAPQANQAAGIVTTGLRQVMAECPASLKIEVREHAKEIIFGNGSKILLKGTNAEHIEAIRGLTNDMVILDECGAMDNLSYVLQSVVLPSTMTIPDSRVILATTPAESPGHDSTFIYQELADTGDAVRFTLADACAPRITDAVKTEYLLEAGEKVEHIPDILAGKMLPKGTTALREYWCEFVTDANKAVVPEMREAAQHIVKSHPRPPLFDRYVSMDPGFHDRTGILFAIYDFKSGLISVEDELLIHLGSTNDIAKAILEKEYELWPNERPYLRVVDAASDGGLRLIADLRERHGLDFFQAQKQDSRGAVNLMRTVIGNHEIRIDPKCVRLIEQLKNATWNNKATDFARAGEQSIDGHYDLVSSLKYLVRSVNRNRNPYPPAWNGTRVDRWRSPRHTNKPRGVRAGSGQQLDLLGNTPAAKRLKKGR